jgi:hypothetical protein
MIYWWVYLSAGVTPFAKVIAVASPQHDTRRKYTQTTPVFKIHPVML